MDTEHEPTVLVVDDEERLVDLFAAWLSHEYAVRTAYGGQEALELLDEDVDVLLLDRLMPDVTGDEVLGTVRERDLECHVSMVTAVEPDFDILEMGFDEYLVKPFSKADLREVVETLLTRKHHESTVQRYFRLVSKRAALESNGEPDVSGHRKYEELQADIEAVEAELDDLTTDLGETDFQAHLHRIERDADADDRPAVDAGGAP